MLSPGGLLRGLNGCGSNPCNLPTLLDNLCCSVFLRGGNTIPHSNSNSVPKTFTCYYSQSSHFPNNVANNNCEIIDMKRLGEKASCSTLLSPRPLRDSWLKQKEILRKFTRSLCSQKDKGSESSSNNNSSSTPVPTSQVSSMNEQKLLLTTESVKDFINTLSEDQKTLLYHSLNVDVLRDKYEGHLGSSKLESHHYLSKYGRPTAAMASEDPTGTLCEVPPKWLHTRLDEKAYPPSAGAIWAVGLKNALPFIGFGFLDNLIMILAGDYIDVTIGTTLGISTMAAAALGNTISDVAGIGSAWYIEELANKIGIKDPVLTPSQFASWSIRWASNGGRAIGVVIGCLLGMVPLLWLPSAEEKEKEEKKKKKETSSTTSPVTKN